MKLVRTMAVVAASTIAFLDPTSASAQAITGGTTTVTLSSANTLTADHLTVMPYGTASVALNGSGVPVATFPITGGNLAGSTATIEHDGSGLTFTSGMNTLTIYDFLINTSTGFVTGDVNANGAMSSNVSLFSIGSGTSLLLTSDASTAFMNVFDVTLPAGTPIGTAQVNPLTGAVPEPATWAMMLLGFGAIGLYMRRKAPRLAFAPAA